MLLREKEVDGWLIWATLYNIQQNTKGCGKYAIKY